MRPNIDKRRAPAPVVFVSGPLCSTLPRRSRVSGDVAKFRFLSA